MVLIKADMPSLAFKLTCFIALSLCSFCTTGIVESLPFMVSNLGMQQLCSYVHLLCTRELILDITCGGELLSNTSNYHA